MNEEALLLDEDYQKESAFLLEKIRRREVMVELLKQARPDKIPEIRRSIAKYDSVIEQTENIMQMIVERHKLEIEAEEQMVETMEMCDAILPELLAHLEKNNPEAYEKLKANLEEIDAQSDEEGE